MIVLTGIRYNFRHKFSDNYVWKRRVEEIPHTKYRYFNTVTKIQF